MKIENGEWILTPSELAACFKETGNTPGELSLIPKSEEEIDRAKIAEERSTQTEEQLAILDKCLKVLGDPHQIVLMHYNLADTTVSRSTLATSEELPGAWVTLAQTGKTMRLSFRSQLEIRNLIFEVLAADNTVRPTKMACDLSTAGALTFLALLDQYRRSWLISLIKHLEPVNLFTIEDIKERLNEAEVEDFRWSLPFTDKLLPIPIKEMAVAQDPRPGLLELVEAGIIEPVNEEATAFDITEAGQVFIDGNNQAACRLVLTQTYHTEEGEPAHDVFLLTRTSFDLFMVTMGGAEASLTTLLPGDLDLLVRHVFLMADSAENDAEDEELEEVGPLEEEAGEETAEETAAATGQGPWHISRGGEQYGPYTWEELKKFAQDGSLGKEDHLWQPGMSEWVKAGAMEGLFVE